MPRPNKFKLPPTISPWALRALALAAKCDPRTAHDYITGRRNQRPAQREAVENALRAAGRADLIRQRERA